MTKKVQFTYPLSDNKTWEGQLHIEGVVEGQDVTIDSIILEDKKGKKADIKYFLYEWTGRALYEELEAMAINNANNTVDADDYTMMMQDNY